MIATTTETKAARECRLALFRLGTRLDPDLELSTFRDAWQEIVEMRNVNWLVEFNADISLVNVLRGNGIRFSEHQPILCLVGEYGSPHGCEMTEDNVEKFEISRGKDCILWQERSSLVVIVTHDVGVGVIHL